MYLVAAVTRVGQERVILQIQSETISEKSIETLDSMNEIRVTRCVRENIAQNVAQPIFVKMST
jgi:hypothetical protein